MGQMQIRVTGRGIDVGDALRGRIEEELEAGVSRYISRDGEGVVTVSKERHTYLVEIVVHLDSGITLESHGEASEAHPAFDQALSKIEKRTRRYKRRLKDHHTSHKNALPQFDAPYAVIAAGLDEENDLETGEAADAAPVLIAETSRTVKTMALSTAVLQLEVSEQPALMFHNASTGTLNMVYRRADGNIGWLDPRRPDAA